MALPVLLHLPHASLEIPSDWRGEFTLSDAELEAELLAMTDRYTDRLFVVPNAERLVFPVSRLVVDPERFRDDAQEPMAAKGMGAYYTHTFGGAPMRPPERREEALQRFYDPHHAALETWAARALNENAAALLIDGHSFPDSPHPCDLDPMTPRPDICLGTDPFHTPADLIQAAVYAFETAGWSVEIDRPYRGAMTPASLYQTEPRMHSIMVELNRRIYMDESTGAETRDFMSVQAKVQSALLELTAAWISWYLVP